MVPTYLGGRNLLISLILPVMMQVGNGPVFFYFLGRKSSGKDLSVESV